MLNSGRIKLLLLILGLQFFSCEKILFDDEVKPPLPAVHSSRLATILDSLRYALKLPALAGAIVRENDMEAQAVGCRRYGGPANVTSNDQFHLGSCGKAFTAALMGVLVDEGLVDWNSTLPEIFPEMNNIIREEYRIVTVKNLLSHTAGFIRDSEAELHTRNPRDQRLEITAWAVQQPPAVPHGIPLYSNMGFAVAGAVIEKVTNRTYEELIFEKIITPLGITTAGFGAMGTEGKEDQPLQHSSLHVPISPNSGTCLHPTYNPAGGLYMSIGDWGKFAQWALKIDNGHQTLLNSETAETIISPAALISGSAYNGLGWGVTFAGNYKILGHSGSNGYNYSIIELNVTNGNGIIVMTNQGNSDEPAVLITVLKRLAEYSATGN